MLAGQQSLKLRRLFCEGGEGRIFKGGNYKKTLSIYTSKLELFCLPRLDSQGNFKIVHECLHTQVTEAKN